MDFQEQIQKLLFCHPNLTTMAIYYTCFKFCAHKEENKVCLDSLKKCIEHVNGHKQCLEFLLTTLERLLY
jgi:hypothetical protein